MQETSYKWQFFKVKCLFFFSRLTPSYMFVMCFFITVFLHFVRGPFEVRFPCCASWVIQPRKQASTKECGGLQETLGWIWICTVLLLVMAELGKDGRGWHHRVLQNLVGKSAVCRQFLPWKCRHSNGKLFTALWLFGNFDEITEHTHMHTHTYTHTKQTTRIFETITAFLCS